MKLCSYSYLGRMLSAFFFVLPSLSHATHFDLDTTLSDGSAPPATHLVLMGTDSRNPRFEQALRDTRAQVEENVKKASEKFMKDGEKLIARTSGISLSSHERPTLESIVARAREDPSRNRSLSGIYRFSPSPVEKSLNQFSKESLRNFRKIVQDEKSSPFDLNESIWDLQSESQLNRMKGKAEQASYLRDQIRSYVDEHGVMTKAYPEIVIPKGYLHTYEESNEGLYIRKTLNDAMASEAIILRACSLDSGASGECEAFQAWSEELNSAFFIADNLYQRRQTDQFYSLMEALHGSTEFIKGFAKGVLDGSINAVVALPQMVLHLPEISGAIYEALSDMPGTYEKVKEIAQAQYERILQADARELGEIAGELVAAAGSTFVAPGVVLRAVRASGPIVKSLGKMGVRAALERGTEVALDKNLIQAKYVAPFKSLSKELPEVAKEVVQAEGSIGAAAEKLVGSATSGAKDILQYERLKGSLAVEEIQGAKVIGSALKEDVGHRSATFALESAAKEARSFTIRGGDGIQRNLLQVEGSLNGEKGIFEWITGPENTLVHQRFIKDGKITGFPNQNPARLNKN